MAIDVPDEVRRTLILAQERLGEDLSGSRLRWQDTARSHLTLEFLGDVAERSLPLCERAVREAARGARPFRLATGDLGVFPSPRRPSVLWLGVDGDLESLSRLQADVSRRLADLSPPSDHPFRPHLTLARVGFLAPADHGRLSELIGTPTAPASSWEVDSLRLVRSRLRPGGAIHELLLEARLERP